MPEHDVAAHERQAQQQDQSTARVRAIAREGAREAAQQETVHAFDSVGIDIETRPGREAHRDLLANLRDMVAERDRTAEETRQLLAFVREMKVRHDERNAQVRKGIIDQLFGLLKWVVVSIGLALGAYFGVGGKVPHP